MPVPTAYTEEELASFMHVTLSRVAVVFEFNAATSYAEAIISTLLAYGVDDIALATDMKKLRALARREAWRLASDTAASFNDHTIEGSGQFNLSELHKQINVNLGRAESDASPYDAHGYRVTVSKVRYSDAYSDDAGETA